MKAGPYIKAQIESAERRAAHYRREAAICRTKANEFDREALDADAEAARWASGTDRETSAA